MPEARRECHRGQRLLLRYVDQELSLEASLSLEQHLGSCPDCRERLRIHQELEEQLLLLPRPELTRGDRSRLLRGVHRRIATHREEVATPQARRRRNPSPGMLVVAAMSLAAGVFLAVWLDPTPTAAPRPLPLASEQALSAIQPESGHVVDSLDVTEIERLDPRLLAIVQSNRAVVLDVLQDLPLDSPVEGRFLSAIGDLPVSARSMQRVLERFLLHGSQKVARAAARVLGEGLQSGSLGPPSPGFVSALERALPDGERAALVYDVLAVLDTPRAWQARLRAVEVPTLQERALGDLLARNTAELLPAVERHLLRLLRSPRPEDREVLQRALPRLRVDHPRALELLAALHVEGAPTHWIAPCIDNLEQASRDLLLRRLVDGEAAERKNARTLIALSSDPRWVDPLEQLARQDTNRAEILETLAIPRGFQTLVALANLGLDEALSGSRRRDLEQTLVRVLEQDPGRALHFRQALVFLTVRHRAPFLEWVARLPGGAGLTPVLDVTRDRHLCESTRALAGRILAALQEGLERDALLACLRASSPGERCPDAVVSSLLVALYRIDGPAGLRAGCEALGLERERTRERAVLRETRSLARLGAAANADSFAGLERALASFR